MLKKYSINKSEISGNEIIGPPRRFVSVLLNESETPAFSANKLYHYSLDSSCSFEGLDSNGSSESNKIMSESDAYGTSSAEVDNTEIDFTTGPKAAAAHDKSL